MAEGEQGEVSHKHLADEDRIWEMFENQPYEAQGYLCATADFCNHIIDILSKDSSCEQLKEELLATIDERGEMIKKWAPG